MTRNLTLRYSIYQLLFFSITAGTGGFAATYLLGKGFSSAQIGLILAATNVASCFLQPLLGSAVDRAKHFVLPRLLGLMAGTSALCFALLILFDMGKGFQGALYVLGSLTLAIMPSLSNSLCAYYTERNCAINFGVGAGIGSLAYSTASLGIGYLIAWRGTDAMIPPGSRSAGDPILARAELSESVRGSRFAGQSRRSGGAKLPASVCSAIPQLQRYHPRRSADCHVPCDGGELPDKSF